MARQLSVSVGTRELVHIDEMLLQPGTITALLGANGSGKTSLLRALAGQLAVQGEIRLGSYLSGSESLPKNLSPFLRAAHVSYLPQDPLDNSALSVDYALDLSMLFVRSNPRSPPRKVEAVKCFSLDGLLGRSLDKLSGGELQRVSLAQKWMLNAPLLLWDEPFNHLDAEHKVSLMSTLRAYVENDSAALISVHGSASARAFATHFVELNSGRIVAQGSINSLRPDAEESLWRETQRTLV